MTTLQDILTAGAGNWTLSPERSSVTFRNKTLWGLATVTGRFAQFSGEGRANGGVSGRVVIRAASLRTGIRKRDEHLRSADFFDVENHPEITVEVTEAHLSGPDGARLGATLTVRGASRPIELPVSVQVLDSGAVEVAGQCRVERGEFGVSGNLLGMVGPTTTLSATLVFIRA